MPKKVNPVPKALHAVTPSLTIKGCGQAIEFYRRALGAEVRMVAPAPDGKGVWHAELRVGDSVLFMNDPVPGMSPVPPSTTRPASVNFWLYVPDCDAAFKRAVDAGATVKMPPQDMFWGDRTGTVLDPFGYAWTFGTHVKDMTEDEMRRAGEEFAKSMRGGG
jgi:PhnB protein